MTAVRRKTPYNSNQKTAIAGVGVLVRIAAHELKPEPRQSIGIVRGHYERPLKLSANCAKGNHTRCFSLACICECGHP